jgi:DNA excision repair protein ERCC-5
LNKQGVLNEFLDISSGSGTHAPRQRQAYASRRLQQVISDFRKQQSRGSVTPGPREPSRASSREAGSGNESHSNDDPESPAAKKRKTKGKPSARGRRVGTSATHGRKSRAKSRTEQDVTMSDGEGDFVPPQDTAQGDPVRERELRPRVKPRPAYRVAEGRQDITVISDEE